MHTLDSVIAFAKHAHRNHFDADGTTHFEHCYRVYLETRRIIATLPPGMMTEQEIEDALFSALLHDAFEDTKETGYDLSHLWAMNHTPGVVYSVTRLSVRLAGTTYQENIVAIADEGVLTVIIPKLADNKDNSAPERIAHLDPKRQSISKRYARSKPVLQTKLDTLIAEFVHRTVA